MTNKEKMLNGELYLAFDEELKKMNLKARKLLDKFNKTKLSNFKKRAIIAKKLFGLTGNNLTINKPLLLDYGKNVYIGNNFYSNYNLLLLDVAKITIGDNVMFGPNVAIYTAGHPVDPLVRNTNLEFGHEVIIGNNVWLGGSVVVNPGVKIGDNVVVASGAVVTKSFPNNVVIGGNPAKIIREINEEDKIYWNNKKEEYYKTINKE